MMTAPAITEGMRGEPLPYLLRNDVVITSILLLCTLFVLLLVSRNGKYMIQEVKFFLHPRQRGSLFHDYIATPPLYTPLLVLHTAVMLGFCTYQYLAWSAPALFSQVSHTLLLAVPVLVSSAFILFKWAAYASVNSLFFQKERNIRWIASFFNIQIWLGLLLLPLLLFIIHSDIVPQISFCLIGFCLVLSKVALFWKCFSNFLENIYGFFHLILYFCALEILPDLILWKGMEVITNILTLNL